MQINTNLSSLNAQRSYQRSGAEQAASLQRLSSGLRINSARDDAAGLAISERLASQVRGLHSAGQNINDGISLLQVADGAVGQLSANYQRMRELAVQAANATNSGTDRAAIQRESDALAASNQDIVDGAQFNHQLLLDGSYSTQLQTGSGAGDVINLQIPPALAARGYFKAIVDITPQQASVTGTQVLSAISFGALVINNTAVHAPTAGAQTGQGKASAYALADAINTSTVLNVTAGAATTLNGEAGATGAIAGGGISINGVAIGAIGGANAGARAASAAAAISAASGGNGVTATSIGGTLTLSAADGRDIIVGESNAGNAASLGLTLGRHAGVVSVSTGLAPGSHPLTIAGGNPAAAGLVAGTYASVANGPYQSEAREVYLSGEPPVDLSTFSGATAALDYLDGRLDALSDIRGQLGAAGNQLAAAAGNGGTEAEQLSASRSRILDTDYASETAQLTRARILQQAGASMLAQANTQPQRALRLLR